MRSPYTAGIPLDSAIYGIADSIPNPFDFNNPFPEVYAPDTAGPGGEIYRYDVPFKIETTASKISGSTLLLIALGIVALMALSGNKKGGE